jgi:DNA helicase-2/ATP-dependent DNA helicase PcrA
MSWDFSEDNVSVNNSASNYSKNGYLGNKYSYGANNFGKNNSGESSFGANKFTNNLEKSFYKKSSATSSYSQSDNLVGKRVFHQKFGYGKVTSIDGKKLEISFEKTGKKTVMKDFVSLA